MNMISIIELVERDLPDLFWLVRKITPEMENEFGEGYYAKLVDASGGEVYQGSGSKPEYALRGVVAEAVKTRAASSLPV